MKFILILSIFFFVISSNIFAEKYQSADKLSRNIPIVSIPKITETSAISIKLGTSINDTYTSTFPISLVYNYKFSKFIGFIVDASYSFDTNSALKDSIDDAFKNASSKVLLPEYSFNRAHLNMGIIFKPIYGKISFFSENIIHFDLYMSLLGGATYNVIKKRDSDTELLVDENKILPSVMLAIGQNYFLTDSLAFNIELIDNMTIGKIFETGSASGTLNQNFAIRVGLNIIF
jgi:outer membrane beta-barrel protein